MSNKEKMEKARKAKELKHHPEQKETGVSRTIRGRQDGRSQGKSRGRSKEKGPSKERGRSKSRSTVRSRNEESEDLYSPKRRNIRTS
jgi:hypothetical protein